MPVTTMRSVFSAMRGYTLAKWDAILLIVVRSGRRHANSDAAVQCVRGVRHPALVVSAQGAMQAQ